MESESVSRRTIIAGIATIPFFFGVGRAAAPGPGDTSVQPTDPGQSEARPTAASIQRASNAPESAGDSDVDLDLMTQQLEAMHARRCACPICTGRV